LPDNANCNDGQPYDLAELLALAEPGADQLRASVVAGLCDRRVEQGFLTLLDYKAAGQMVGRTPRQVQRWMRAERVRQGERTRDRHRERFECDELVIATVYAHRGTLRAAYRDLVAHQIIDCSEDVFRTAWKRLNLAVQKFPKIGHEALRNFGLYRMWSAPKPNMVWQLDSHQMDIFCVYRGEVVRPWRTDVLDDCSRFVPGALVTLSDATARDIAAVLAMAMRTRVGPDGKTLIGGKPKLLIFDCAQANLAEMVQRGVVGLDITPHPAAPYEPTVKGKKERHYRTFENECLSDMEGYITPEAKTHGMDYLYVPPPDRLPSFELVCERVAKFDRYYNFERDHGGVANKKPFEVLAEHSVEIDEVSPAMLARAFLDTAQETYKVHKQGIHVRNRWYTGGAIALKGGEQVIVRYLPDEPSFVEVFDSDDDYLGRVTCQDLVPADESDQLAAARDALTTRVNQYHQEGLGIRAELADLRAQGEEPSIAQLAKSRKSKKPQAAPPKTGLRAGDVDLIPGLAEIRNWDPNEDVRP